MLVRPYALTHSLTHVFAHDLSFIRYGPGHVNAAHELTAIDTLLISDSLFRTTDPRIRRKYEKLVEDVRGAGGTAFVLSSGHGSGVQLEQLSGLAAILRFPLPDLEDMEFEGGF